MEMRAVIVYDVGYWFGFIYLFLVYLSRLIYKLCACMCFYVVVVFFIMFV